jgi:hypothetical protein
MTGTMDDEISWTRRKQSNSRPDLPPVALPPPLPFAGRANLRVPAAAPNYADMVARATTADPADWKWYDGGIQVPVSWYEPFRRR